MKSIILSSVVTALLVFSGCSSKEPIVDEKADTQTQEVKAVETETVSTENSTVAQNSTMNSDTSELAMANVERQLSSVYFDFDQFSVRDDMQNKVSTDAAVANGVGSAFTVKLEGNCDEWGSDEYNFALGLKRASAVKNALVAEGVASERITMVSYGESNPICADKSKECWSQNRRVDFKILP